MDNTIVCFGEILWDKFKDFKRVGGAPFNVACRLHTFGFPVTFISSIGKDKDGDRIREYLIEKGMSADDLQLSEKFKTGEVKVQISESGEPHYEIVYPRAWDDMKITKKMETLVENSKLFVFGSLIARSPQSKETLFALLKKAQYKIFDLNLRPPFYDWDTINFLINTSNFLKLNETELDWICEQLSLSGNIEEKIRIIKANYHLDKVCVTLGEKGAAFYDQDRLYTHPGFKVKVSDTVGAGDSFLASLIYKIFSGFSPQESLNYACAAGALVASKEGATPDIHDEEIKSLLH